MVNYCLCSPIFYLTVILGGKMWVKKLDGKFWPKKVREKDQYGFLGFWQYDCGTFCLRYRSIGSLMPAVDDAK